MDYWGGGAKGYDLLNYWGGLRPPPPPRDLPSSYAYDALSLSQFSTAAAAIKTQLKAQVVFYDHEKITNAELGCQTYEKQWQCISSVRNSMVFEIRSFSLDQMYVHCPLSHMLFSNAYNRRFIQLISHLPRVVDRRDQ